MPQQASAGRAPKPGVLIRDALRQGRGCAQALPGCPGQRGVVWLGGGRTCMTLHRKSSVKVKILDPEMYFFPQHSYQAF